ncbi:glutamate synthase large subunit [candidate division KSB1 bacterium]|nr:glutamate synthase large subunit [candidate division KSB1 bacterium]RQW06130.1 MAG: glutamate synthase large subunit [candidate division KSB1 bacterium]
MKNRIPTPTNAAGFRQASGLYHPAFEHDACGVGFVARLDAKPDHQVVLDGIQILVNLEHRGAIGGDAGTGDGAGLLFQLPDEFFRSIESDLGFSLPEAGDYAVGMVFLPTDAALRADCKAAFEGIAYQEGAHVLGWRHVPTENGHLGALARSTQPVIEHIFLARHTIQPRNFERKMYIIRRLVEKEVASWKGVDASQFYVVTLSSKIITYKGLITGTQLTTFYADVNHKKFKTPFALVHQRFSTNTLPTWQLAQPFRALAHNGEINTLRGNINRMKAREARISHPLFGDDIEKIKPIIIEDGSDSAIFDNTLELLIQAGRSLPHAIMMMIPEAYGPELRISRDKQAFYEYHSALMEPWDGPAAIAFTDGRYIGATLDRNGLRPARYTITKDGVVVMASETGVLEFKPENILRRGRLQPGKMFLVDLQQNRIVPDNEIKAKVSRQKPYRRWVKANHVELRGLFAPARVPKLEPDELIRLQHAFFYTEEELKMLLSPMAVRGQEPVGSMGNDASLAVLSDRPQLLFNYFRQLFAQVTNPPIDPLREQLVMSLESFVGREKNFLEETPEHYRGLKLQHPVLTPSDLARIRQSESAYIKTTEIDMLFSIHGSGKSLEASLNTIFQQAKRAILSGASIIILTDKNMTYDRAPIPVLLAASGLHHFLIKEGIRNMAGIVLETGEVREVMHFSILIAYGTDAICPYLAFATIRDLAENDLLEEERTAEEAMDNYITAVKKGLLKTISRMGQSTIHSFFGSQIFEAIGISNEVIDKYFCNTASRVGGLDLDEIAREVIKRHGVAFPDQGEPPKLLDPGGVYHIRIGGEQHMWSTEAIYKLQLATRVNDYSVFKEYSTLMDGNIARRTMLRSLLTFKKATPVSIDEVESVEAITRRFVGAAMSFGSISREAHEAVAIAMNRIGARSNSGEGGEDPARYIPLPNGDRRVSRIKQIASGRFGVTTEYVMNADELQIKIAQGAKPGEGGQLPGHKVNEEIARVRHTTPGVTLISPPPHHDIYSIEDLAQLIFDLKAVNPAAKVSVKLVSEAGVGTIAAGVAKAKADTVLISGCEGGTGASPLSSIKHAGLPWELGLAETQQSLMNNHLRDQIRVQTDGQLKTGRDLAIATLLGAEEFGFGTAMLITLGCIMMRKCHLNTCPVGVATQDPRLRERFGGSPDYVERFLRFIAQEFREIMAELGFRTVEDMVGRVDMLEYKAPDHWKGRTLDLNPLLNYDVDENVPRHKTREQVLNPHKEIDSQLIELAKPAIEKGEKVSIDMPVRNIYRTVGAQLSGHVVKQLGAKGLPDNTINIIFSGSAGQSFGAFLAPGINITLKGDVNDYMGKMMSGGRITVVPPENAGFEPHENIIVGNVLLYGATGGEVYINGIAGERFMVRNSGARGVVEGVGDHGCEYMTGGLAVILGRTGNNFAAGMSGGIAYVWDETELFDTRCNLDMVDLESVWHDEDKKVLRDMIEKHYTYTSSSRAKFILDNWEAQLPLFVKVMPIDYRKVLERMRLQEEADKQTVAVTEEVYNG